MRSEPLLTIMSLLTILLMTLHVTDDIVRGISPAGADNLFGVVIFVVWLLGTLMLAGRASGHIIMLLGGVFAAAMPVGKRSQRLSCCPERASHRQMEESRDGLAASPSPSTPPPAEKALPPSAL